MRGMKLQISPTRLLVCMTVLAVVFGVVDQLPAQTNRAWSAPFPPFRITGNLYYVGSEGLASYFITTEEGGILINSNLENSVPLIRDSIEKLGFKFSDIKILLISHAHFDHCAGSATIKQLTGATYMVMEADVPVIESGGKLDFHYGNSANAMFPITKVDRVLHDGDKVKLGDTELVAHLTPGHTKGCTTWTMKVAADGKTYDAVIIGSPNVNAGYRLVNNKEYPRIAEDYEQTFRTLLSLPCDLFLGAHGDYFGLDSKYPRLQNGDMAALVDPEGYKKYVTEKQHAFQVELEKQRAAAAKSGDK
jgi:metallo-beta-lactamase class B